MQVYKILFKDLNNNNNGKGVMGDDDDRSNKHHLSGGINQWNIKEKVKRMK